jgi:hypothetical protein
MMVGVSVVERFLVTVDRVYQVDEAGRTVEVWPGERLFDVLILGGGRLRHDEQWRWQLGRAEALDLRIDPAAETVHIHHDTMPGGNVALTPALSRQVLAWYRRHVDAC